MTSIFVSASARKDKERVITTNSKQCYGVSGRNTTQPHLVVLREHKEWDVSIDDARGAHASS